MINMSVNGVACNPSACTVVSPGAWSFSGSAFATGNVVDTTYSLQAINPPGAGGAVTVVVGADTPDAASVSAVIGGVDRGGSATGSVAIVDGKVTETLALNVGANGSTGGDYQATWVATQTPPFCTTCVPPPITHMAPIPTLGEWGIYGLDALIVIVFALFLRGLWSNRP